MEYDPNNFNIIEEYKRNKSIEKKSLFNNQMQQKLSEFNPDLEYSKMKFIKTLRNATDYYEYNGCIYACYSCEKWYLESTDADAWIKRVTSYRERTTPEEIEKIKKDNERMLNESLARISGSMI